MYLCKRDLSRECKGGYKDCTDCVLNSIRAEIEKYITPKNTAQYDYEAKWQNSGLRFALKIIDKYKAESEG